MLTRSRTSLAALAVTLLLVAGCGGSDSSSSGGGVGAAGTDGKAADAFPATTLFFADMNMDTDSDAWAKLRSLGEKFPAWDDAVADIEKSLAEGDDGVSFQDDIKPWLGKEAAIGVTGLTLAGSEPVVNFVAYVESTDDDKARATLTKDQSSDLEAIDDYKGYDRWQDSSDDTVVALGNGALLVANNEATLNEAITTREEGDDADRLSGLDRFTEAMGELPEENLAVAYLDGPAVKQVAQLALAQAGSQAPAGTESQLRSAVEQLQGLRGVSLSLGAEDEGARLRGVALGESGALDRLSLSDPYSPSLMDHAPGDSLFFASYKDLGPALKKVVDEQLSSNPQVKEQVTQFEGVTNLSIERDIVPLLSGEHGLYVSPGAPVDVGLLLKPDDAEKGATTLERITAVLGSTLPVAKFEKLPSGEGQQATIEGQKVVWRRAGDVIGIGNDPAVGDEPSSPLSDDADFTAVRDAAGQEGDVTSLLYADFPGIVDLMSKLGDAPDAETAANLEPLGGLLAWGTIDGDKATFDAFLHIR